MLLSCLFFTLDQLTFEGIKEKDCCITKVFFFKQDYVSIIDNIVAFGPTVKILAPEFAVKDVVSKLKIQKNLFDAYQ